LQVELQASNGCPVTTQVAGTVITFTAPSSGAGGTFASSGSNTVTVGANSSGGATAPGFTANGAAGSYTVTAASSYGSVAFSLTNTATGIAATITGRTPTSRSATVGSRYAEPLQATVLDANGDPVEDAPVTFTLGTGGGGGGGAGGSAASPGATFDGGAGQATVNTDSSGTATSPTLTANSTAGTFTATASTAGVAEPALFSLVNVAGPPPTIRALAPTRQSATVGARYAKPLAVTVLDGTGRPVQGATVTFSLGPGVGGAGGGGASPSASFPGGASQATEVTDASGTATSPAFTANATPGRFSATATTSGTPDAASFALDNLAGRSPTLAVIGASGRSAAVGAHYARPLQVRVRDGSGEPVEGASVTFTLGAGGAGGAGGSSGSAGASFVGGQAQASATTDAAGIATSPRLVANTVAGTFVATATTNGTAAAAGFSLRNLAGAVTAITPGVAASESTATGARFPVRLAVTVTDPHGNPVSGVAVTFTAPARGVSGRFDGRRTVEVKTDAKGVAVAPPLVANGLAGGYVVRASAGGHSAAFALINQRGG
jgi:protocatechuate 3,4-dioxygenase beta subunit